MIYIYRRKASDSARILADSLPMNCRKLNDLQKAHYGEGVRGGDRVICWGEEAPSNLPTGVMVLNGAPLVNKLGDAIKLKRAQVATVEVSSSAPTPQPPPRFDLAAYRGLSVLDRGQANSLRDALASFLSRPETPSSVWLPRRLNHVGGTDLLNTPVSPEYWSRKENIVEEYRLHIFKGKSIRAGIKVAREGVTPHPWVRSYDGGWRIKYDDFHSKKSMRAMAVKAVEALGLEFGAVDLGKTADGTLLVLEVNRAPGLEGGTINAYADAIDRWIRGVEGAGEGV